MPGPIDCLSINRNLTIDDFPELLRPMSTVMGRNRTVTSSSKILKLVSFNSVNMTMARH